MEYRAYLDITRAEISSSGAWFYVTINLEGTAPADASPHYGVEIDSDKDGRGDWLIYAASPHSSDWTAVGVRARRDSNNDVGGERPLRSENPPASGDGYDELVFDSGHGPGRGLDSAEPFRPTLDSDRAQTDSHRSARRVPVGRLGRRGPG